MLKALNPLVPEWYTPEEEKEDPNPTEFLIRPLSGVERADVEFRHDELHGASMTERGARVCLKHGLRGWKNFQDSEGPVKFNDINPEENMRRLPLSLVTELAFQIWHKSHLNERALKNSQSVPTSAPTAKASDAEVADGGTTATKKTRHAISSS